MWTRYPEVRLNPTREAPILHTPPLHGPIEALVQGDVIKDVWEVERKLGAGGMGSVYRCRNQHANRIVAAIKLLDASYQHNQEAKARFLREAEILYTLDHPGVVRVSNVDLDSSPPFLEMEFVEGRSLEADLMENGALGAVQSVDRALQIAEALAYLHRKRIYHRDVKPQNLLIRDSGEITLVDFGLAKDDKNAATITQNDVVTFGTVAYCPPEWGTESPPTPAEWDLYGLGVVLYEMLTGTVAFPTPARLHPAEQIVAIMEDKDRIQALDPGPEFRPSIRDLVKSLTHKDPSRRPSNARAVVSLLKAADTTTPDEAERTATPVAASPTQGPKKSNFRVIWIALAMGLVGGLVVSVCILALLAAFNL